MSLTGSYIGILSPQLVVLYGKVMESLGGGTLLEEVHHRGQCSRVFKLAQLSVFTLLPMYG